ncbi:hypothetical protein RRG08_006756 [Elysia crispata]|uniref:Uncharacterized protein n=1 Tax=Elysia crispata TaxID=231223 RepID=A0AAE0ZNG6_9GAST|nr:hypothetical protein RRG08_006756 [Elysia crispata]
MAEVGMTAQQFTECLDRMLNQPDISLITSEDTPKSLWLIMLSELWPLPSPKILQHPQRDGQMRNLNENEQLRNQIIKMED